MNFGNLAQIFAGAFGGGADQYVKQREEVAGTQSKISSIVAQQRAKAAAGTSAIQEFALGKGFNDATELLSAIQSNPALGQELIRFAGQKQAAGIPIDLREIATISGALGNIKPSMTILDPNAADVQTQLLDKLGQVLNKLNGAPSKTTQTTTDTQDSTPEPKRSLWKRVK